MERDGLISPNKWGPITKPVLGNKESTAGNSVRVRVEVTHTLFSIAHRLGALWQQSTRDLFGYYMQFLAESMATDSADHISRDQDISRSTERKQRLLKGKRADGVYQGCAAASVTNISSVWHRLERAEQRESWTHALIGGHCHAEEGELTRSEWSYMIGLGENRIFVWKQRH